MVMWIAVVIIAVVVVAWLIFKSPNYRVPEQNEEPKPELPIPQAEQWREVVHPVKRGDEPVLLQTTRANQKPTIAPYIECITVPEGTVDLRMLDSRRLRVVGASHRLKEGERIEAWTFQLVREPNNGHDENAIAVHLMSGRQVGYVAATQAESYAPLLDQLGRRFLVTAVGSAGTTSSRLWVDLPKLGSLRALVAEK